MIIFGNELGEILRKERIKKKLSIADVSRDIYISSKYIKALEDSNYSDFAGDVYVLGFLRTYAEYLEIKNLDYLIELFKENQLISEPTPVKELVSTPTFLDLIQKFIASYFQTRTFFFVVFFLLFATLSYLAFTHLPIYDYLLKNEKDKTEIVFNPYCIKQSSVDPVKKKQIGDIASSSAQIDEIVSLRPPMVLQFSSGATNIDLCIIKIIRTNPPATEGTELPKKRSVLLRMDIDNKDFYTLDLAQGESFIINEAIEKFSNLVVPFQIIVPVIAEGSIRIQLEKDENAVVYSGPKKSSPQSGDASQSVPSAASLKNTFRGKNQKKIKGRVDNLAKDKEYLGTRASDRVADEEAIKKILITLIFRGESYLSWSRDGREYPGETVAAGDVRIMTAENRLQIRVGNGASVVIKRDGHKSRVAGPPARPVDIIYRKIPDSFDPTIFNIEEKIEVDF